MSSSKYFYPAEKKIPLPITIAVVLLIIFFLSRLFGPAPLPSKASNKSVKSLQVVNPTHNQIGLYWLTDEKETGWVIYGSNRNSLDKTSFDERDLQDKKNTYHNHYVLIKNLQPDKEYFYKIVSNNELISAGNNATFTFKTPSNLSAVSNVNPAYGKIIRENGQPLEGAIVILKLEQTYSLLALSKTTGEWLIPLGTIIDKSTLKVYLPKSQDKISIDVFSEEKINSNILTRINTLSPLPQTVIIGKNYDFLDSEEVLAASSGNLTQKNKIDVIFPREGGLIPGLRPLIKGTAVAGNLIQVTLEGNKKYTFSTRTDNEGFWTVTPKESFSAGSYLLRLTTQDINGKTISIVRRFKIAKSGEQVLAEATPEATITSSPTPTDLPIVFLSPTLFYTPTATQTPTLILSPPTSGINIIPVSVVSASLIILGLGILLAF